MADQELLAALRAGRFHEWQEGHPGRLIDLSGEDIIDHAVFAFADLRGANLSNAVINPGHLLGRDLSGANLDRARFGNWKRMHAGEFAHQPEGITSIMNVTFDGASMCGTILRSCHFVDCSFAGVHAIGVDFTDSRLMKANFKDAVLSDTAILYHDPPIVPRLTEDGRMFIPDRWPAPKAGRFPVFRNTYFWDVVFSNARLDHAVFFANRFDRVDFSNASMVRASFGESMATECKLSHCDIRAAHFYDGSWKGAEFDHCIGTDCELNDCHFASQQYARRREVTYVDGGRISLEEAHLEAPTSFVGADLRGANFQRSNFVKTDFTRANLTGSRIYGISAWDVCAQDTIQTNLIMTDLGEPELTVDNIEIAQFVRLLLTNEKMRGVIDTMTSKTVLILGSFSDSGMVTIEAIREAIRERGLIPITFEWQKLSSQSLNQTVRVLAGLARYIVIDFSQPFSTLVEAQMLAQMPTGPVLPTAGPTETFAAMQEEFWLSPTVLKRYRYVDAESLKLYLLSQGFSELETRYNELREKRDAVRRGEF